MSIPNQKSYLRFKGFTDTWDQYKLGELGQVNMNRRIFKEQTFDSGDIPFYKIGTFGSFPDAYISRELFEEFKMKYPYPEIGDVLISASGSIGRIVVYTGKDEYFQDSNIVWLKHNDKVQNAYLKHFYSIVKWSGLEGSTIQRLYNKNILETIIKLPSISEQNKIGLILDNIDDLITLQQRRFDKLVNIKKSLLEKLFPNLSSNIPIVRFRGFTETWKQQRMEEITLDIGDGLHGTPNYNEEGDIYFINGNNLVNGSISINSDTRKVTSIEQSISDKKLDNNTILMSINGTIGNLALYNNEKLMLGKSVAYIQTKNVYKIYLYYILQTQVIISNYQNCLTGSTIKNLGLKFIKETKLSIPEFNEQTKIGTLFSSLDNLILLQQRKCEKLKQIKLSLLEKMFI